MDPQADDAVERVDAASGRDASREAIDSDPTDGAAVGAAAAAASESAARQDDTTRKAVRAKSTSSSRSPRCRSSHSRSRSPSPSPRATSSSSAAVSSTAAAAERQDARRHEETKGIKDARVKEREQRSRTRTRSRSRSRGDVRRDSRSRSRSASTARDRRSPSPRRASPPRHRRRTRSRSGDRRSRTPPRRHVRSRSRSRSRSAHRDVRRQSRSPARFSDRFGAPPERYARQDNGRSYHSRSRSRGRRDSRSRSPRRSSRHSIPRGEKRRRSPTRSRSRSPRQGRYDRYSRSRSPRRRFSRSVSRSRSMSRSRSRSPRDRAPKKGRWDQAAGEQEGPNKMINAATGEEAYLRRVATSAAAGGPNAPSFHHAAPFHHPARPMPGGNHAFNGEPLPALHSLHQGTVVRLQPFGAFVSIGGFRKHGLVHISRIRSTRVDRVEEVLKEGQSVWTKVVALEEGRIALSMKDVDQATGADLHLTESTHTGGVGAPADLPDLYSIHRARVARIEKFGAFVDFIAQGGARRAPQGLIHISQMSSSRRVDNVEDVLSVGDEVHVKVVKIENGKIGLSIKDVDQATGADLDPSNASATRTGGGGGGSSDPPPLYSIHRGKVVKLADFGAFVSIDGYRKHGLVHIGQLAAYKVDSVDKAVSVDESVWVKVVKVEDGGNKIGLSMKYVNQQTGKDLDPGHVNSGADEARAQRSANFDSSKGGQAPIELGAVHNVDCTRCGARGHLSSDCMAAPGVRYDASRDADDDAAAQSALMAARQSQMSATKAKNESLDRIQQALAIIQAAKEAKRAKKEKKKERKEAKKSKKSKKESKKKKKKSSRHSDSDDSDDSRSRTPSPRR